VTAAISRKGKSVCATLVSPCRKPEPSPKILGVIPSRKVAIPTTGVLSFLHFLFPLSGAGGDAGVYPQYRTQCGPGTPSLPGSLSHRGPVAALESDLPVPTLAPLLDSGDARFREMAISFQNTQAGFAELLSRVSLL
jgi:hypothetical protein